MRSRRLPLCILIAALAGGAVGCAAMSAQRDGDRIRLSVLYVGDPQTDRAKDFTEFLEKHFAKVGRGDLAKFREGDVAGWDAVILDYGELVIKNNAIVSPSLPFARAYARPTVTVGATGALMCSRMNLKTGYL